MKMQSGQVSNEIKTLWRDVLVIDADPRTTDAVKKAMSASHAAFRTAASTDHAALEMKRKPADLIVVNVQMNDNHGMELMARLRQRHPGVSVLAVSGTVTAELAMAAWRAGAADLLMQPIDSKSIRAALRRLAETRVENDRIARRNAKLRTVCKKLNKARHEISQQVNLLCNDLVRAYQDLAQQLNTTQTSGEFTTWLGNEMEIETILRKTLEWILDKVGPLNAAILLPDSEGELSLGAYLNYDTEAQPALIDAIAATIGKTALAATAPAIVENDQQLDELYGNDASLLRGRQWLAAPAYLENESLAVICIFRTSTEPIDEKVIQALESICPVLATRIGRAIRIHQRGLQFED